MPSTVLTNWLWRVLDFCQTYGGAITALATVAIGIFTLVLVIVTRRQAILTKQSVRISERALVDLERPYIYIFGAKGIEGEFEREDPYYYLEYSVANYGRTPATIEGLSVGISVGLSPQTPTPIVGWHSLLRSPILRPNTQRQNIEAIIPENIDIENYADEDTPPTHVPTVNEDGTFYFWVTIKYRGPFTRDHETSACWRWQGLNLVLHGGDQYNYTH